MTVTCSCGGRFRRSDIVPAGIGSQGHQMYQDTDNLVAHWKCTNCGAARTQRKRQPRSRRTPIWDGKQAGGGTFERSE